MSEKRELKETLLFEKNYRIHGGIYHKMQVDFAYNPDSAKLKTLQRF